MNTAALHQAFAEGEALRAVVVAADDKHLQLPLCQAAEEIIKEGHRFRGWDCFIIDVAGNQHGGGMFFIDDLQNLQQNVLLIVDHGDLIDTLADVQVR